MDARTFILCMLAVYFYGDHLFPGRGVRGSQGRVGLAFVVCWAIIRFNFAAICVNYEGSLQIEQNTFDF